MKTTKMNIHHTNGTCLQGYVDCSYKKLVEVFGQPNGEGDDYKVDVEWDIDTPEGMVTIYNYKDGKNYLGANGKFAKDIRDWHIGGHGQYAVNFVNSKLQ